MYKYGTARKNDALRHAIDANGGLVGCGAATLRWDDMYGYVTERVGGGIIARHAPILDGASGAVIGMRVVGALVPSVE